MPTRKSRVSFIPRAEVLDLINKLSFEGNLSNSKIINILVEEALYKRGLFNIKNGTIINYNDNYLGNKNQIKTSVISQESSSKINNNFIDEENIDMREAKEDFIDKEIYTKFLMFLQFQEKMRN